MLKSSKTLWLTLSNRCLNSRDNFLPSLKKTSNKFVFQVTHAYKTDYIVHQTRTLIKTNTKPSGDSS